MGYTTDFSGEFKLNKKLSKKHKEYLAAFSETRRMKRNPSIAETLPDKKRLAVKLPIGIEAEYFVGGTGMCGQDHDKSITDYNAEPSSQPGLWCQWVPDDEGTAIVWDGGEKFYCYVEWIEYIIKHFLEPWGYKLNGEVEWQGEESDDRGLIVIKNNKVSTKHAFVSFR